MIINVRNSQFLCVVEAHLMNWEWKSVKRVQKKPHSQHFTTSFSTVKAFVKNEMKPVVLLLKLNVPY